MRRVVYAAAFCSILLISCSSHTIDFSLPRPIAMTVIIIEPAMHVDDFKSATVEVTAKDIDKIYGLIKPVRKFPRRLDKKLHVLVAEVECKYADGSIRKVYVRWTGDNPAAVSFDDEHYYEAGMGEYADGAMTIVRLLLPRES